MDCYKKKREPHIFKYQPKACFFRWALEASLVISRVAQALSLREYLAIRIEIKLEIEKNPN
jgi:hypothetical protein